MIRIYHFALHALYVALDFICVIAAVLLAYWCYHFLGLGKGVTYEFSALVGFALVLAAGTSGIMFMFGAYNRNSGLLNVLEIRGVILGVLLSFAVVNTLFFALRFAPSRYIVAMAFLLMLLLLPLARSVLYAHLARRRPRAFLRRVLIYGAGELGQRLFREISNSPRLPFQVLGFIDDNPAKLDTTCNPCGFGSEHHCRVLGDQTRLPELAKHYGIDEIYIAISGISNQRVRELFAFCRSLNLPVAFVPGLHEIFAHRIKVEHLGNLPLVRETSFANGRFYERGKRTMDLAICALLAPLLLPMMALLALAVRLNTPGPAIFRQQRVGQDGALFTMYKFRTMHADTNPYQVTPNDRRDRRITRVGRFLRRSSLDELPQVFNVIKGEMSWVGPRPEMPFIVEQYNQLHRERLQVKPGITGLWQLSGDRNKAIHENMEYDLYYVYNRSFFLDLTILLQTLVFAFRGI